CEAACFRHERIRCAVNNCISNVRKYLLLLYTVPSERMAKSFKPTSIRTEEPVLGSSSTAVSTRIDTKYFPRGLRLTVAFRIRPFTSRLLANFTNPSLGN